MIVARFNKCIWPLLKSHPIAGKTVWLFHDDTLQRFFRCHCFSPGGSILVASAGILEDNNLAKSVNATYIYTRNSWKTPTIVLPSPDQFTVAARFCPNLFESSRLWRSSNGYPTALLHAKTIQYQCRPNVANFTLHWNDIGTVFIYCVDEMLLVFDLNLPGIGWRENDEHPCTYLPMNTLPVPKRRPFNPGV